MKTSTEYLKLAMEKLEKTSDAQAAKALGIARSTLSEYLSGRRIMDDYACVMVATVLNIDPMEVIAACHQERERTEDRREFWRNFRAGVMRNAGSKVIIPALIGLAMLAPQNDGIGLQNQAKNANEITAIMLTFIFGIKRRLQKALRAYCFVNSEFCGVLF